MTGRANGKRWQVRFALGSLFLHGLLLSLAAGHGQRADVRELVTPGKPELEIEMLADEVEVAPTDAQTPSDPERREASPSPRTGTSSKNAAHEAAADAELASADAAEAEASGEAAEAPSTAPASTAPHLGLTALGIDGQNPFLERGDQATLRAAKTARLKRRLDKSLAQGLTNQDVASGRGAGSPIIRSLEAAVYASTVPLNGSAFFTLIIDSEGKLLSNTLGQTSGDRESWARVARQTAQALAQRKLTVPKGRSVRVTVEVTSHLELPSGRDPGLDVDAFGVPIGKGGGPRATKLDFWNPRHPLTTATLEADPADLAAPARRMVHAHVVSEELL